MIENQHHLDKSLIRRQNFIIISFLLWSLLSLEVFAILAKADWVDMLLWVRCEWMNIFTALEMNESFMIDVIAQYVSHDDYFSAQR